MSELKPCPFCGSQPRALMGYNYHKFSCSNDSCEIYDTPFQKEAWNTRADGWVSVEDELPEYGKPIILSINNTVQHVTYMLDGYDDSRDWFEPYHYEDKGAGIFVDSSNDICWMPLPPPPKA